MEYCSKNHLENLKQNVASRSLTLIRSRVTELKLYTITHKLNCKSKFIIYLMRHALPEVQYDGKAETAFNIKLTTIRKA